MLKVNVEPIKVCYLLGSLNRGGTETLLLDLFNYSGQVPFEFSGIYRKEGTLSGKFHASNRRFRKLSPGRPWMLWLYLWQLRKVFIREKIKIVHAQQNLDALYAMIASIGLPIKRIQTIHGFDIGLRRFNRFMLYISLKICHVNVFVSHTQKNHFEEKYRIGKYTKKAVVYNGINPEKFNNPNKISIRSELSLSKTILLLGMVGNFVLGHDQLTICRFLALLSKSGIDFCFLFIGGKDESNPKLYEDCRNFCFDNNLEGKVLFLGSRSDVPVILPQLDAFFYASDHDTFGISVIEAIASGIPVFINNWEVMKEITENGRRAILYRTKDECDLFDKFSTYVESPELYKKKALENSSWAIQTYSIQSHIGQLFKVYNNLT